MQIFVSQINPTIGDIDGNGQKIIEALQRARAQKSDLVLFPELTLSGYFPDDLLLDKKMIEACLEKLEELLKFTKSLFVVVGLPRINEKPGKPLFNSAAVIFDGKLLGFQDKSLLPTYDVFDERRFFEPAREMKIWSCHGKRVAITICEDVWQHAKNVHEYTHYDRDPVLELKKLSPELVLNISGSPYSFERLETRINVFAKVAKTLKAPVVLCNQVGANDQLIFDGNSFYIDANGHLCQMAKGFEEDDLIIDLGKKASPIGIKHHPIQDLYSALLLGVRDYFHKQGFKKAILGLSGGIDSALVACIAREALGSSNVTALSMPSRFTSKRSVEDARELAKRLAIELIEISIESVYEEYMDLLKPFFKGRKQDETEENIQSRIRGMLLMAYSNKFGVILLNTGNKSEMALGYCTLYGDMAGGLGVLHDVTKLKVFELAKYAQVIPESILEKEPSAELKKNQKDTDVLPPFEILDPILEDYLEKRLSIEKIAEKRSQEISFVKEIVSKIHKAEYKRRQAPISLRVTPKAFSKGRIVPIVQKWIL